MALFLFRMHVNINTCEIAAPELGNKMKSSFSFVIQQLFFLQELYWFKYLQNGVFILHMHFKNHAIKSFEHKKSVKYKRTYFIHGKLSLTQPLFVIIIMHTHTQTSCWKTESAGNADKVGNHLLGRVRKANMPICSRAAPLAPAAMPTLQGQPLIQVNAAPEGAF